MSGVAPTAAAGSRLRATADHEAGRYKWFVAGALCLAHTVAVIDRFVIVLVTEPIRAAMQLSDTQLGLLQGSGFAILYCGFALPLGCIADSTNRRNLIAAGLALWSVATIAAAFTTSFAALFATRIMVGMGEACLIPAGMSLLSTYFAPANLARGTAIFGVGANFGYGFAFLGGGIFLSILQAGGGLALPGVGLLAPWQGIFLIAGLSAIPVLILLVWLREPPRDIGERSRAAQLAAMLDGVGYLWGNLRSYAPFLTVGAMTAVTGYAMTSWSSSLFVRVHGVAAADAGRLIGLAGVIAGPLGTICGGVLLDRMRARGVAGAPLVVMAGGCLVALGAAAGVAYAPNLPVATALFCLFVFQSTFTLPSLYVGVQMLTPDRHRGIAASFNMMVYTLAGLGLGPAAVGAISDRMTGRLGLAHAIVIVEAAMMVVIVPIAILARQAFDARMSTVAQGSPAGVRRLPNNDVPATVRKNARAHQRGLT